MIFIYTVGYIFSHGCNLGLVPLSKYRPPGMVISAPFLLRTHQLYIPVHPCTKADPYTAAISVEILLFTEHKWDQHQALKETGKTGKFVILAASSGSRDTVVNRNSGHDDRNGFQAILPMTLKPKLMAQESFQNAIIIQILNTLSLYYSLLRSQSHWVD